MRPIDKYRKRLKPNSKHHTIDTTSSLLDETFHDSPLYFEVDVRSFPFHENIKDVDEEFYIGINKTHEPKSDYEFDWTPFYKEGVRVNTTGYGRKELLMRNDYSITTGDIIKYDDKVWMVTRLSDKQMYPKATMELCTTNVPIEINGQYFNEPCLVSSGRNRIDFEENSNRYMLLDKSRIEVSIQYNEFTSNFQELDEFWIGGKNFKLIGVDMISDVYEGRGIINMEFERYSHTAKDESGEKWEGGW